MPNRSVTLVVDSYSLSPGWLLHLTYMVPFHSESQGHGCQSHSPLWWALPAVDVIFPLHLRETCNKFVFHYFFFSSFQWKAP